MTWDSDSVEVLSAGGSLACALPGFCERSEQIEMAQATDATIARSGTLVVEAGTGVGKTFAYLVPALLSGRRVIVSTGTRHLQDQLFNKDLPLVRKALNLTINARLLKGRANYLCLHRLDSAESDGRNAMLGRLREWSSRTPTGDLAEMAEFSEDSPLLPRVTSTADNCLGSDCPRYKDCFLVKARRAAQQADLVIINHHVLMADLTLKEEGFGELLPNAEVLILDEAHQLAETAAQFLGVNLSSRQIEALSRDVAQAEREGAGDSRIMSAAAVVVSEACTRLLNVLPTGDRGVWPDSEAFNSAFLHLGETLAELQTALAGQAERSPNLRACGRRAGEYRTRFSSLADNKTDTVRWFERGARSFVLRNTPTEIDGLFGERSEVESCARIFTSATLAVDGDFSHFKRELGLSHARYLALQSPFDYEQQALLYLPPSMPDPQDPSYTRVVVEMALPVIEASGGAAFLLFTSHKALREAAGMLSGNIRFPLLIQGEAPKAELLRRFRAHGNAVLLGAASFWEGVDVRGPALRLVVIDKLPFASPGDPVLAARLNAMRERGENPFMDYQLPQAVLMLKQGVGRLIRDQQDAGVLMLCDPRLRTRPYGKIFLKSLPDMPVTNELPRIQEFFRLHAGTHEAARA